LRTPNLGEGEVVWVAFERALVSSYKPLHTYYFCSSNRLPEILDCSFQWGCEPTIMRKGRRRGSAMVQFERALVSFYRPSIVTFPLSLCVSEILPLMFSRTPLFHYPTSSLLKISPCSRWTRWIVFFGCEERRCRANCLYN